MLNIENPYHISFDPSDKPIRAEAPSAVAWAQGSNTGIIALLKWLFGKCTGHEYLNIKSNGAKVSWKLGDNRKDCPECMEKIRKEYGIK